MATYSNASFTKKFALSGTEHDVDTQARSKSGYTAAITAPAT